MTGAGLQALAIVVSMMLISATTRAADESSRTLRQSLQQFPQRTPEQTPQSPPTQTPPKQPQETEQKTADDKAKPADKELRLWIEFIDYAMEEFDGKLALEGNNPVSRRVNAGILFNVVDVPVPFFKNKLDVKVPAGIEYLSAYSKSTFDGPTPVTVQWSLPVVGVFVAPTIVSSTYEWLYLRPIGVGYYTLGKFASSKLTVTDRPGRLDVSASALGLTSVIGVAYPTKGKWQLAVEVGYRRLQFGDVTLQPREGFVPGTVVPPGSLPELLDYSGLLARTAVVLRF